MIACIMGQFQTVKKLVELAKLKYKPDDFKLFLNVKVIEEMGGNNALLYACNATPINEQIIEYLVNKIGADIDVMNDNNANLLLVATKKGLKNVLRILLQNGVDIT